MRIEIIREDEVKLSVFSPDTPLTEVMEDVAWTKPGQKPVTAVRRVSSSGEVLENLPAWQWRARKEEGR